MGWGATLKVGIEFSENKKTNATGYGLNPAPQVSSGAD
jgi:hypothetical protein